MTASAPQEITLDTYESVRQALLNKDLSRSIDAERFERGNIKERTLSVLHGDEHRDRRKVENALFRRTSLELYERVLFPDIVRHTLATFVDTSEGADLMEIGGLFTTVLAARTAGVDLDRESLDERQRLRHYLHLFALGGALDVARGDVEEIKEQMRAALAEFDEEFVRSSWERRAAIIAAVNAGTTPESDLPADALTTLLLARSRGQIEMDDALLLRETTQFFTAGAHTSTQTMTHTLHQVFAWCAEHPEDWSPIADDLYLAQRAAQEALRCRPTNPKIHRRALRDTTVGDREIPAGTLVLLDTFAANADPAAYGPDAARFDPHRRCPDGLSPWGSSFGGGMHLCIGRTLAVGLPVRADDTRPGPDHLYGLVPQAVQALLRQGVRPDPQRPPQQDTQTERWTRWAAYPVVFEQPAMAGASRA